MKKFLPCLLLIELGVGIGYVLFNKVFGLTAAEYTSPIATYEDLTSVPLKTALSQQFNEK